MKRFRLLRALIVMGLAVVITIVHPLSVSAHILRDDDDMTAELHMPPDDAPVTGVPAILQFTFEEGKGDFTLANCDCKVSYVLDGKTIATQALIATSETVSRNTYTFDQPGNYTFKVTGSPKEGATFESFTLSYDKRVGGKAVNNALPSWAWIGIGAGVVLIVGYALFTMFRRRRS